MPKWSLRLGTSLLLCFLTNVIALSRNINGQRQSNDAPEAVHPAEASGPLPNPYMGWGIWVGRRQFGYSERSFNVQEDTLGFGDDALLFNWVLVDWDWASLEPKEGQFNWSDFDAVLKYWAARHKQFIVRFWVTDDPGWNGHPGAPVLPEWIWKKGVRYNEYKGNGGVMQRELNYADPSYTQIYLPELQKFLAAFAERYDKPGTPVIFLQAMGYGHWADWATWYSHYRFPSVEAKHEILSDIMKLYIRTFKHIQLMEMADRDWNDADFQNMQDHIYNKALDVALAHHFGLEWTGFIDGLKGWDRDIMETYWRDNPIIAEGNWSYDDLMDQKTHGTFGENLSVALNWHANFFHLYFDSGSYKRVVREQPEVIDRGLKPGGLGYRLVPVSLSWRPDVPAGDLLVFGQTWVNRNVGRLYVLHPLKLYLTDVNGAVKFSEVDTGFDETTWIKGKRYALASVFHIPKNLAPGIYDVRIALVDGNGTPRLHLGIAGEDSELRYRVGRIRITSPEGGAGCDKAYCP